MRKTAIAIMLVGFVFAFFSVRLAGVDLLIDAVGFLLVFNGVRPLQKSLPGFGQSSWCALALVLVSALQLFLGGFALLILGLLRSALEVALYLMLMGGFSRLLQAEGRGRALPLWRAAALLCALAAVFSALLLFVTLPALAATLVLALLHLPLLLALVWLALLPAPASPGK